MSRRETGRDIVQIFPLGKEKACMPRLRDLPEAYKRMDEGIRDTRT